MKNEIKAELEKLLRQAKPICKKIEEAEEDWINHYDKNNPDDLYLRAMFYQIAHDLERAMYKLDQVNAKVVQKGVLTKNSDGRYAFSDGSCFTSGEPIEYLETDYKGDKVWVSSRVEHNGEDYYIVSDPKLKMEGLFARVKMQKVGW